MTDTILPGIDGDLIDGPVGDDTLFGDYDDEVTVEQIALLKDGVAHLGMDDWGEAGGIPAPDIATEPNTVAVILDGRLWRIIAYDPGDTIVNGKARRLVEVEEV